MSNLQEETASPVGSDKVAEEEGEDLDDDEYDEEEDEDDDERPRKKPRHGGYILDEAGRYHWSSAGCSCSSPVSVFWLTSSFSVFPLYPDVDDEYEDEEEHWEEGAEDILEKGEKFWLLILIDNIDE